MADIEKIKRAYYRSFQGVFGVGEKFMSWRKPELVTGPGSIREIPRLLADAGVTKPMLVTGPNIVKTIGKRIMELLDEAGIGFAVYSEVEANPSVVTAECIYMRYTENGCNGFIALGGGSPMDAAKAAAALCARPDKQLTQLAGLLKVGRPIPPIIAIPTTSGTGSETTVAAVITDRETNHKYAIMDLHLIPRYAILDPELTLGLPPRTTATTGMDALTHAVEAYLCWTYNTRESIRDAEEAVERVCQP